MHCTDVAVVSHAGNVQSELELQAWPVGRHKVICTLFLGSLLITLSDYMQLSCVRMCTAGCDCQVDLHGACWGS